MPITTSRVLRSLLLACAAVVLTAGPAAADAAGPTDFRSEVTALVPESDVVQAEIHGGDSFLELRVDEGHTVIVYGYTDADGDGLGNDPYLRFNPDGTVERNRNSTATYLNEDRQGDVEVPPETNDPTLEPEWEQVADGGVYAWHDHRVHWMLDDPPQDVERGEKVGGEFDPWRVPISIDGEPVEIQGTLTYEEPVSLLPYIAVGLLVAAALAWFGRAHRVLAATSALTIVAALALVVGRAELDAAPAGQASSPLLWVLPAIALVSAVAALFMSRRTGGSAAGTGLGGHTGGLGSAAPRRAPQACAANGDLRQPRPAVRRARSGSWRGCRLPGGDERLAAASRPRGRRPRRARRRHGLSRRRGRRSTAWAPPGRACGFPPEAVAGHGRETARRAAPRRSPVGSRRTDPAACWQAGA